MKCFYHGTDLDGHCSGAIIKNKFPECEMIPADYGMKVPWKNIEEREIIYIVDFTFPIEDMYRLGELGSVTWIDHHETAIKDFKEHPFNCDHHLMIGKAGCELTWEYIHVGKPIPQAVHLLGRYDVWDESITKAWEFQAGMRRFKNTHPDSDIWKSLLDNSSLAYLDIIEKGKMILDVQTKNNADYIKSCMIETVFEGHKAIAVNRAFVNSKIFDSVWDHKKYSIMITFVRRKGIWNFTLYTTEQTGVHVGVLAQKYGGGGHAMASGFASETIPFEI